jgi:hypothetical protein
MTQVDYAGFQTLHPALDGHSRLSGNRILASLDSLPVHGDVARNSDAEFAGATRYGGGIGARYQSLDRDAAGVDAGSTNFRSMMATFIQVSTSRAASGGPACPVPMMMASKYCISRPIAL